MQEQKFAELEERAVAAASQDDIRQMEARVRVVSEIAKMRAEGTALALSDEEMRMLAAFRQFKVRMRKNGEVFTWQTAKPEGVQIVEDTAEIVHPCEYRGA